MAWTWNYNGFDFLETGPASVVRVEGLDLPPIRSSDVLITGAHGGIPGLDRLDFRTINMTLDVVEATDAALFATLHELSTATQPRDDEIPLTFRLDDSYPEMIINCRPRRRHIPISRRHAFDFVPVDLQFLATDPLIYSAIEHSVSAAAQAEFSGWSYDWDYDWDYGSSTGSTGYLSINNQGTAPTHWTATIMGPCTDPKLTSPLGQVFWQGSLAAGEILVLNSHPAALTALLGGTASRYELLSTDSTWFSLTPGDNSVLFTSATADGTVNLRWRDAWWSAT